MDDPLEAEAWASSIIGNFYKIDGPLQARDELETRLWPEVVRRAERRADREGLAVLEALAAVTDVEAIAADARDAADRLRALGIAVPAWAAELGSVAFESAWMLLDVFGDHEAYYATFRYPGRTPHIVNALYDKAMGEIIKDAFVGYSDGDPRTLIVVEDGVRAVDAEPGVMARRVVDAIANGDLYLDNDWTPEFRQFRALVLARMRRLPVAPPAEPPGPPDDSEREAIAAEFLSASALTDHSEADIIVSHCLDYVCDYLGEDPFRWSPIVVEQFLLDYLPRKVSLGLGAVAQLPAVLRAWVRFALLKRRLEERWIVETEEAVDQFAPEFRQAMTDADEFGPAKLLGNAMLADGVNPLDQASVDRWVDAFNARPIAERDALLRRLDPWKR
ncbi:MAG: hypothetical protein HY262_10430 [Chloroflexi bacterium]|nr:hypothetical protein [Chloroflexota bacterium]